MNSGTSRRKFLTVAMSVPVSGLASPSRSPLEGSVAAEPAAPSYRVLGRTGLKVTPVGFGCLVTSDPSVIRQAVDACINFFDTARSYQRGNNERMVGVALRGLRDKVILGTKSQASTRTQALADLETSLEALGTDHVDIWYMHSKDSPAAISDELIAAFIDAKRQGKARFIGVSTHDPNAVADRIIEAGNIDVVLFTYNFTMGTSRDAAIEKLRKAGIGLVAMKVMAPATAGKPSSLPQMKTSAGPLAALKWVIKNPAISSTVPSMVDTDQLEINVRAMSEKFSEADAKILAQLNEEIRPVYCRMCFQCRSQCPKGVPVADTLRFLSYADFYGQFALGREHFLRLPEQIRTVRCNECSSCAVRCPNGVHVAERLVRAQELFG